MAGFLTGLLELTLASGVLIALLLLLLPVLAKRFSPRWRYWAWLALALRLAIPFNLSLPEPLITLSAPVLTEQASPRSADMLQELEPELPAESVQPLPAGTENGVYAGNRQTPFVHSAQVVTVDNGQVTTNWLRQAIQWPNVLFAFWAAGALTALAWQLCRHCAFLRLCRRWRRPTPPLEQAEADRRAEALELKQNPVLYRCAAVSTPMLTGLFHPVILLPLELKGEALSVALDHELRHAKRHDLWYKALLLWIRCLHWFNPLVWLMCRRAEGDLEQCCDSDLLQNRSLADRRAYGALLLDQMTSGQGGGTPMSTGFSSSRREVLARFKSLLDTSAKKTGRAALAAVTAAALLGSGLVACQAPVAPAYDDNTGIYQDDAIGFTLSIPQTAWDQLEVVVTEAGEAQTVSFVSRAVLTALGEEFDPSEDYWLRVRLRHLEDGSTVRDATYGEADDVLARCIAAGLEKGRESELTDLYAAAKESYQSLVFVSADSGGETTVPQQAGDFYYEEAEVYLNFDLGFGLEIPRDVYEQLTVVTDLRRNSGSSVLFLDRRLVEELGWDTGTMLANRNGFLVVNETAGTLQAFAGESGTLENHESFRAADQRLREAVLEMSGQAEGIASTLFDLSAVDAGLAEGDTYDPRSLYNYRAKDDRVWISIPGWAMAQIRTSYEGDLLIFSTLAGDPLLYWEENAGFTLPNLSSRELSDASEAGVISYMDLQNALLMAEWTTGENSVTIPLGTATVAYSITCPDGTYQVSLSDASLNDSNTRLYFSPAGEQGGYYLPIVTDVELLPLFSPPEGQAHNPEWVIFSGMASSAFPHLEVTVQDNRVVSFACVLGDGPLAE